MTLLIVGLALWVLAHGFKRIAPAARAHLGDAGKGLVAATIFAGVVLMVLGYRRAGFTPVYEPLAGMGHLNNLLMLVSVYLFGVGQTKGVLSHRLRHPMLMGTVIWAVAHLLVNGDLASVVLFGGIGLWALAEIAMINRAEPWTRPAPGTLAGDAKNLVATLVIYAVIAGAHIWLGHNPFLGTYA